MFSVVIPLYNKADTIERAIQSVLRQSFTDFEIIVVDDGSTDSGADVVCAIGDSRIRLIQQPNGGVSAARNHGIQEARNEYVCFLDADDEYLPEYLAKLNHLIQSCPDCGVWAVRYFTEKNGEMTPARVNGLPEDFEGVVENYFDIASKSAPPIWTGAVCCTRTALLEIGGFPVGIRSGEDLLTWARLCAQHSLAYCMIPLVVYHLGETAGFLPTRVPQEGNYVGKELIKMISLHPGSAMRRYFMQWQKNRISAFTRLKMRKKALGDCLITLRYWPFEKKIYLYILLNLMPYSLTKRLLSHS